MANECKCRRVRRGEGRLEEVGGGWRRWGGGAGMERAEEERR